MATGEKKHSLSTNSLQSVGLPPMLFLFTLDQIAGMLGIEQESLMKIYIYFEGRSAGLMRGHMMRAVNIAADDAPPDWRVSAKDFVVWCKRKGYRLSDFTTFG